MLYNEKYSDAILTKFIQYVKKIYNVKIKLYNLNG